jgi:hypothetical protein
MNRDFLKEAIADAKAVKESAIANAKAALEESFAPHLKSILAAKLEEMDKEEMGDDMKEAETKTSYEESNLDETSEELKETEVQEEELNLDEILAELGDEESTDESVIKEEESEESEETEVDLESMTDEDLKKFVEDVIKDMVEAGELEPGEAMETEDESEKEAGSEEVDVDVDELVNELRTEKLTESYKLEVKTLKSKLNEAYSTIKTLQSDLNEINLLNAKLLYTNKIFKSKNLSESQKLKVLGAFDKAVSVKEVKLVFETLNESFNTTKTQIKENLGLASKPTGTIKRINDVVEVDPMVSRFKKLAGIK